MKKEKIREILEIIDTHYALKVRIKGKIRVHYLHDAMRFMTICGLDFGQESGIVWKSDYCKVVYIVEIKEDDICPECLAIAMLKKAGI